MVIKYTDIKSKEEIICLQMTIKFSFYIPKLPQSFHRIFKSNKLQRVPPCIWREKSPSPFAPFLFLLSPFDSNRVFSHRGHPGRSSGSRRDFNCQ